MKCPPANSEMSQLLLHHLLQHLMRSHHGAAPQTWWENFGSSKKIQFQPPKKWVCQSSVPPTLQKKIKTETTNLYNIQSPPISEKKKKTEQKPTNLFYNNQQPYNNNPITQTTQPPWVAPNWGFPARRRRCVPPGRRWGSRLSLDPARPPGCRFSIQQGVIL